MVCLPTMDGAGLAARLSPHFGRAPWFTCIDANGEARARRNEHAQHEHGHCLPAAALDAEERVSAVVCAGIGRNALAQLEARGIRVFLSHERTVREALAAYQAGSLREMVSDDACHGGHHPH